MGVAHWEGMLFSRFFYLNNLYAFCSFHNNSCLLAASIRVLNPVTSSSWSCSKGNRQPQNIDHVINKHLISPRWLGLIFSG